MSDFILNQYCQQRGSEIVQKLIAEYNNPDLTPKGKLEVLTFAIVQSMLEGYYLSEKIKESKNV
jgi:hypothetical protein